MAADADATDANATPAVKREGMARLGVPGLDEVLGGGFTRNRLYLLEGSPSTGATTIALRFLLEGAAAGLF